jgi:pyruvate kinase
VKRVQLPHPEIINAARIGTTLLLDDGKLRLRVVRQARTTIWRPRSWSAARCPTARA